MNNQEIRQHAREQGVKLWQVAKALGISEPTMTRRLRSELPAEEKGRFLDTIDRIAAEHAKEVQA